MLGIIFNTSNKDYGNKNINTDKAAEHIVKITQNSIKNSQQKK
ncbi:hypothetical protein Dtox_3722 [Desulfofarcimen acetoxidans DSM 771]|uniref:Uncharacterized protein n=1 Tax=Desulfofarcimen acetoxidans (strain ATCC 49208 / DSM 771 / KCTC 5769 / VKM B-1644 / 5575) TaxID=485916 RepID=C8VWR6_DESAS|nr:hypothetical protein Dtox_3722 [Desulfofarcimen acetoxidans DSM 771]